MEYFLAFIGIFLSFFMIKYRESLGNSLPEADWMRNVGGIYTVVVFVAIVIFFWSIATLTGSQNLLFAPLKGIIPWNWGGNEAPASFL